MLQPTEVGFYSRRLNIDSNVLIQTYTSIAYTSDVMRDGWCGWWIRFCWIYSSFTNLTSFPDAADHLFSFSSITSLLAVPRTTYIG